MVLYRHVDVGAFGPIPNRYDPCWPPKEEALSAIAEGSTALAALALSIVLHIHAQRGTGRARGQESDSPERPSDWVSEDLTTWTRIGRRFRTGLSDRPRLARCPAIADHRVPAGQGPFWVARGGVEPPTFRFSALRYGVRPHPKPFAEHGLAAVDPAPDVGERRQLRPQLRPAECRGLAPPWRSTLARVAACASRSHGQSPAGHRSRLMWAGRAVRVSMETHHRLARSVRPRRRSVANHGFSSGPG